MSPLNKNGIADFISTAEAAERFGYSPDHIARLCRSGELECARIKRGWLVSASSIEQYSNAVAEERELQKKQFSEERKRELIENEEKKNLLAQRAVFKPHYPKAYRVQDTAEKVGVYAVVLVLIVSLPFGAVRIFEEEVVQDFVSTHSAFVHTALSLAFDPALSAFKTFVTKTNNSLLQGSVATSQPTSEWKVSRFISFLGNLLWSEPYTYTPPSLVTPQFVVTPSSSVTTIVRTPTNVINNITNAVTVSGVSEGDLATLLADLESRIVSRIPTFSGSPGVTIVNTQTFAQSQQIDQLAGVDISASTWEGGTISNATITGGTISAGALSGTIAISNGGTGTTTAPTYGQLLLGNANGEYDFVATSTLGFIGSAFTNWSISNGALAPTTTLGILVNASSTISDLSVTNATTTNATSTNLAVTGSARFTSGAITVTDGGGLPAGTVYLGGGDLQYNGSDFMFSGGNVYTAANSIVAQANSSVLGLGARYQASTGTYWFGATNDAAPDLIFSNNAGTERARLTDGGNFGLGTTSPFAKLSVAGDIFANGSITGANLTATGTVTFSNIANGALAVDPSGNVYTFATSTWTFASSTLLTDSNTFSGNNTFTGNTSITNASTTNISASYASSTAGFFGSLSVGNLTGILRATAGAVSTSLINLASDITGILAVVNGGTGWGTIQANALLLGNGTGSLATTSAGTNGQTLALVGGVPTWVATTTFSSGLTYSNGNVTSTLGTSVDLASAEVTGILPVANGGTGLASYTLGDLIYASGTGTLAGTSTANLKTTLALNNVENTALSTWAGTSNITTLGTIATGVWQGTPIGNAYLANSAITINGTSISLGGSDTITAASSTLLADANTFSGNNTFTGNTSITNASTTNISASYASSTAGFFGSLSVGNLTGILRATAGAIATSLVDLANDVTGVLPVANGGTGATSLDNLITLGTHTSGNYLATLASSGSITVANSGSESAAATVNLNLANANAWTALQTFANASSSLFSAYSAYFGGTATSTFGSNGSLTLPSGASLTMTGTSDGCATFASGALGSTGVACGGGGSSQWTTTGSDIYYDDGNVGIGTTSPQTLLHLYGSGTILQIDDSSETGSPSLIFSQANTRRSFFQHLDSSDNFRMVSEFGDISFYTANDGNELVRMTIDENGNVGIGTTTPPSALSVTGTSVGSPSGAGVFIGTGVAGTNANIQLNGTTPVIDFATTEGIDYDFRIQHAPASNLFSFHSSTTSSIFNVTSTGNVGIGTTTPGSKLTVANDGFNALHVAGSSANSIGFSIQNYAASGRNWTLYSSGGGPAAAGTFGFYDNTAAATRLLIDTSGNVGIGTTTPLKKLSIYDSTASFGVGNLAADYMAIWLNGKTATTEYNITSGISNNNLYLNVPLTSNDIGFRAVNNTSDLLTIKGTGNVGIGTTAPGSLLHINGSGSLTGDASLLSITKNWGNVGGEVLAVIRSSSNVSGGGNVTGLLIDADKGGSGFASTVVTGLDVRVRSAVDTIAVFSADDVAEAMRIMGSGNVGIGTTTPATKLDVYAASGVGLNIDAGAGGVAIAQFRRSSGADGMVSINAEGGDPQILYDVQTSGTTWSTGVDDSDSDKFMIGTGSVAAAAKLTITTTGDVGIGNSSPSARLHVTPSAPVPSSGIDSFGIVTSGNYGGGYGLIDGTGNIGLYADTTGTNFNVAFGSSLGALSSPAATVSSAGRLTITGDMYANGTTYFGDDKAIVLFSDGWLRLNPSRHFTSGIYLGTGITRTDGQLQVGASGGTLIATSGGDVGIGVNDPDTRLEVFETVAGNQLKLSYDASRYAAFQVTSVGDLVIDAQGGDVTLPDENLFVCAGGSCPAGTPTGTGNLVVERGIGVNTATPITGISVGADSAIITTEKNVSDASPITIDWNNGNQQLIRLAASRTVNFSNASAGQTLRLVVCTTANSRVVTWGSTIRWAGGVAPTQTATANKCDVFSFIGTIGHTGSSVVILGAATSNF